MTQYSLAKKALSILTFGFILSSINYPVGAESLPGDTQFAQYTPALQNQRVAIFANSTSQINQQNIIKVLLDKDIHIVKIFTPEHGFYGLSDAGAKVGNSTVESIPVISLYGKKTKPSTQDLKDVDVVIFDMQDVGVRYYTYISSLQRLMEALTVAKKPLIILDRPNPNGFYIDGPVLEPAYKSFVGMQPVPIVYGMTIGEYAKMLVGEQWLDVKPKSLSKTLQLTVIPIINYTNATKFTVQLPPSPNLPNMAAIYWYPSLGWFEGTQVSVGRGTDAPFQQYGAPFFSASYRFTPQSTTGASSPPYKGQQCFGWDLQIPESQILTVIDNKIQLSYLINAYRLAPDKAHFFNSYFNKLAGNSTLQQQIKAGISESQIRISWQVGLDKFKLIRQKYLLYPEH